MRRSSIQTRSAFVVASVLALGTAPAGAHTLVMTAAHLHDVRAGAAARDLRVTVQEHAGNGTLRVSAGNVDIPALALAGRLDWHCALQRDGSGVSSCAGPVEFMTAAAPVRNADLAARVDRQHVELILSQGDSHVALNLPFAGAMPIAASLQQVPAAWIKTPLAALWKGGELRSGVFDVDAKLQPDDGVEGQYRARGLTFNTLDGSIAGDGVTLAGHLRRAPGVLGAHIVADAILNGGALRIGTLRIRLPDTSVDANIDASVRSDGRWEIAHFGWWDPGVLEFDASGQLDASALAPLHALAVHIDRVSLPLAGERYAKAALAAQGLGSIALKGDLAGDLAIDERGPQRIALMSAGLDIGDRAHHVALAGVHGKLDWARDGQRPATTLGWRSARFDEVALTAASARWQSRDGTLRLLGALRTKMLGGELKLERAVLDPRADAGARLSAAFALRDIGYEGADGSIAAAHVTAGGQLSVAGTAGGMRVQIDATLRGGEALAGPVYVKLPESPVTVTLAGTASGARWQIDTFGWRDPGVLDLGASGEIALNDADPLQALRLDLRNANLKPALSRYAQSWLATKGYGELAGDGALSGTLQLDGGGIQHLAFVVHDMDLRDGAGRFAFAGVEGGVDWDIHQDSAPTSLGWRSIELFRIPLGAATARLETSRGRIVLAQPLGVDVLGGQFRLEKLGLRPRSPRGERYTASFAIAGIDMAQLSDALGWPRFGGNLSGGIPDIVFSGDTIEFDGGLDLYVFDGHLGVSGLKLERPFGVAPSLGADIHFENFDLDQLTQAFSFGGVNGRLDGSVGNLRLVDWSPVAFDAWLRTNGGGRVSYKAVNDLTAIGGGLSDNLQTMALKMFHTFGYRRLGIRCSLRNEVCAMAGIDPPSAPAATAKADASDPGYTIVEGSGVPRITIVGHRRRVDWPTLVRRLAEAMQGQGPVIH